MRVLVVMLAIALVCCQAAMPSVDQTEDSHVDSYEEGKLVKALEKFKQTMRKGDTSKGIPVLDPLSVKHLDVNVNEKGVATLKGVLDNLRAAGLSDYEVKRGDFTLAGLKVNITLLWKEIDLMTRYNLKGALLDDFEFYGDGGISLSIGQLEVSVDLKLSVRDKKLYVAQLELHAHVKKFDFMITGLYNDEEMSKVASQVVTEIVPGMLDDYQQQFSEKASPILAKVLNKILENLTLKDLLDLING